MHTRFHGSPGIEFSETLSGGFSLGARDPERGFIEGTLARTPLSIHCEIRIPDVAAFASQPEHAAELDVVLDFAPLGEGIRAKGGTFQLFTPDETGDTKRMIYRFDFQWDGQPYTFEGEKYMHDGASIASLWGETTRLYSYLYRRDPQAPSQDLESAELVGAGVLEIGVRGVMRMLRSMRVTDSHSALENAGARARLGAFFASELWDLYRGHATERDPAPRPAIPTSRPNP